MERTEYLKIINDVVNAGPFKDDWNSMAGRQAPAWLKNGKFGIFIHWGVYSVPAFGNEWYSRGMYLKDTPEYEHHIKIYGNQKDFGYKDFIPMFKAQHFDADEWADLFAKAGAKFCVPVAEHHDGFQMYKSELSHWNAYEMGPKRDVIGELSIALQNRGIVNGLSSHRIEHWFFMGHGKDFDSDIKEPLHCGDLYWPSMPEPDHHDLFSEPMPSEEFLEDWLMRCCELVDRYQPKEVYFDWWIQHSAVKPYLKKFAAYYYNRASEWGEEVVIAYKHDAFAFGTALIDIERGKFADIQPFYWQTDTAIARNSWCWTENNTFKGAYELVCDLIDIVSKNGSLLLNVGPKPDGTISDEDRAVLLGIGDWLKVNGEAVYNTTFWRKSGEGPTKTKEGQFTDGADTEFTSEDIRFTVNCSCLYATVLKWPDNGHVVIRSLAEQDASKLPVFSGLIENASILGGFKCSWKRDNEGLHIKAPSVHSDMPVVIKLLID